MKLNKDELVIMISEELEIVTKDDEDKKKEMERRSAERRRSILTPELDRLSKGIVEKDDTSIPKTNQAEDLKYQIVKLKREVNALTKQLAVVSKRLNIPRCLEFIDSVERASSGKLHKD